MPNAKTKQKFFLSTVNKGKKTFYRKKLSKEKWGVEDLTKKRKEVFLTALAMAIKKDPTTSIGKHASELKVHEKTVKTVIKRHLIPDLNLLDYTK